MPRHHHVICPWWHLFPRLKPLGRDPSGGLGYTPLALTAPTTMRVVDRVHRHTTHMGALASPAVGTCFAQLFVFVLRVGYGADCGYTAAEYFSLLTTG